MTAKWTAGGREKTTPVWVKDENGKTVCNVARCADDWNRARLIAAAPDLYLFVASKAESGDNEALELLERIHGNAKRD